MTDKTTNYAVIEITHRLNTNTAANQEKNILDKVLITSLDIFDDYAKMWIAYNDEENKLQVKRYDTREYRFKILELGDADVCV